MYELVGKLSLLQPGYSEEALKEEERGMALAGISAVVRKLGRRLGRKLVRKLVVGTGLHKDCTWMGQHRTLFPSSSCPSLWEGNRLLLVQHRHLHLPKDGLRTVRTQHCNTLERHIRTHNGEVHKLVRMDRKLVAVFHL